MPLLLWSRQRRLEDILVTNARKTAVLAELIAVRHGRVRYRDDNRPDDGARAMRWVPPTVAGGAESV